MSFSCSFPSSPRSSAAELSSGEEAAAAAEERREGSAEPCRHPPLYLRGGRALPVAAAARAAFCSLSARCLAPGLGPAHRPFLPPSSSRLEIESALWEHLALV